MKKRNLKILTLKKIAISNLEKTKGGLIDSQNSCYGSCLPNNTCYLNCEHAPPPPPLYPVQSIVYWLCPR
jgi:hypothetical protein